jgi:hypothetical protein
VMAAVNGGRHVVSLPMLTEPDEILLRPPLLLYLTAEPFEYPRPPWPVSFRLVGPARGSHPRPLRRGSSTKYAPSCSFPRAPRTKTTADSSPPPSRLADTATTSSLWRQSPRAILVTTVCRVQGPYDLPLDDSECKLLSNLFQEGRRTLALRPFQRRRPEGRGKLGQWAEARDQADPRRPARTRRGQCSVGRHHVCRGVTR